MARRDEEPARREVPLVHIFLSSPGDVAEERMLARQLIEAELPKLPSLRGRLALQLIAWDDPAAQIPMLATETPQESVNAACPRPATCDIVIVILWSRMGTPLPDHLRKPNGESYLPGTEWEYLDAVQSMREPRPDVLVYRRTEEPMISIRDPQKKEKEEQFERVEAFFARFRNTDGSVAGGVNEYAAPDEFQGLLRQHLGELLHRHLPPPVPGQPHPVTATVPAAYRNWLRRTLERVELLGAKEGRSVTLNSVYVPALAPPGRVSLVKYETLPPVPLLQRLEKESLYVPAPAGAGKSTFCRWAVLQSTVGTSLSHPVPAPEKFAEPAPGNLCGRLPLLVPLREFWRSMPCGRGEREWRRGALERALATWIDASPHGLTGDLLLAHLKIGSAFLLLDGLDEVVPADTRDHVTVYPRELLLTGLADALPAWLKAGNRVLLTSRPYGLDDAGLHWLGLRAAALEPLPKELQDLFVARWFDTLGKSEKTRDLIETIRGRDDLAPLVENPMLLTAICILYDSGGRLPEDRYELYKNIVAGVLHNRYPGDASQSDPVERRLEAVALRMHVGDDTASRHSPAAEISWFETERLLARFAELNPVYERDQVEAAVRREDLLNRSGLLVPRAKERAAFYHLSFQEFLAAQRLSRTAEDVEQEFRANLGSAEWRATLLFLFAAQIAHRDAQWGLRLLSRLSDERDREEVRANPAPAVFIAEALTLCLAKDYAVPEDLKDRFRRLAVNAIEDEVQLQARQALGLCLGQVGDPRIRNLRSPATYVEVPAGTYLYGDVGKTVEIATPFRLARYPVSNSQYQSFLDDAGYRDRRWWSDAGWKWLQKEKVTESRFWRDRRWNVPNQPVVGVSFWEAEACCAWAGGRLPREQEWEAAARGPHGYEYPWGDYWRDGICNTSEANLGVISPVGLFPRARQARLGIEDLAGNVWEWCGSLYEDQNGARVLRGGSWNDHRVNARSAFRFGDYPFGRSSGIGFRVVCSSSINEH